MFFLGVHDDGDGGGDDGDDGDDADEDYFNVDTNEVIILAGYGSTVAIHPACN